MLSKNQISTTINAAATESFQVDSAATQVEEEYKNLQELTMPEDEETKDRYLKQLNGFENKMHLAINEHEQ